VSDNKINSVNPCLKNKTSQLELIYEKIVFQRPIIVYNVSSLSFNTTAQLNSQNLGFLLKSEARNPKSETISNVKNADFQNKNHSSSQWAV